MSEKRKAQLEAELAFQKERFLVASRRGMAAVKADLSIVSWMRAYPKQSAVLIMIGGYFAAQLIRDRRIQAQYRAPRDAA